MLAALVTGRHRGLLPFDADLLRALLGIPLQRFPERRKVKCFAAQSVVLVLKVNFDPVRTTAPETILIPDKAKSKSLRPVGIPQDLFYLGFAHPYLHSVEALLINPTARRKDPDDDSQQRDSGAEPEGGAARKESHRHDFILGHALFAIEMRLKFERLRGVVSKLENVADRIQPTDRQLCFALAARVSRLDLPNCRYRQG